MLSFRRGYALLNHHPGNAPEALEIALVNEPPPGGPPNGSSSAPDPQHLPPTYAVFEMLRDVNQGVHVPVSAEAPLVALATMHEGVLRLMLNNNTAETRSVLLELQNSSGFQQFV